MAPPLTEKAPIDCSDYAGLQLDTRAIDQREKELTTLPDLKSPTSTYQSRLSWDDEKKLFWAREAREAMETRSPISYGTDPVSATSTKVPPLPRITTRIEMPLIQKPQRICGIRRKWFWSLFTLILAIITVGAVLGGIFAARRSRSSTPPSSPNSPSSPNTGPLTPPGASNPNLPWSDVIVNSPLVAVAFTTNSTGPTNDPSDGQAYRIYFQSAHGNVKESRYNGVLAPWQAATPIFTDALNNTGLAAISSMNNSFEQSSIFYVGANQNLQEKRLSTQDSIWWPGTLDGSNLKAYGNLSISGTSQQQDPNNTWDSYRMTAVYSADFFDGPQARLYYHMQTNLGLALVQEMIWTPNNDTWVPGHQFHDPWPSSDLAATIDTATKTVRLFYSSGNLTLQEAWLNMSLAGATWQTGIKIPGLLAHNDASIAAVSTRTNTLLYYYSTLAGQALCVREITISGTPGSPTYPEIFTNPFGNPPLAPIVAQPALVIDSRISLYQPIAAVVSTADAASESIQVFWTEDIEDVGSGYSTIKTVQRNVTGTWATSSYGAGVGQVEIPLGSYNSPEPSS